MYSVTSSLKKKINEAGLQVASDLPDALETAVASLLDKAIERCKSNDRKTVRPCDL